MAHTTDYGKGMKKMSYKKGKKKMSYSKGKSYKKGMTPNKAKRRQFVGWTVNNKNDTNNVYNNAVVDNKTVTNSSTEIIAARTDRKYCAIVNIGNKDCWLSYGSTAVANKGMLLGRQGGSIEINKAALHTLSVNGITASGTTTIAFIEGRAL